MKHRSKCAFYRRVATYCLFASLLGAATAFAEEDAVKLGASLSVSYSVRPQMRQGEDDGRDKLYAASLNARVKDTVGVSLQQLVETIEGPRPSTSLLDPQLGLSYLPNLLEDAGVVMKASLRFTPGLSQESREADYFGSVRTSLAVVKALDPVTLVFGTYMTKHLRRYTLSAEGTPNVSYTQGVNGSIDVALPFDLSLGVSTEYRKSTKYVAASSYAYSNALELGWAATKQLSFAAGLSTTDAQLDAGGHANNGLDFYRPYKTTLDLSATLAL